jgi:pyruvate dehydrogenase E2 component (dihydrolipoamide acetyltransferase)
MSDPAKADIADTLEMMGIPRGSYDVKPLSRVQKFIAQRLTDAARDVPSFPLETEIQLDALLAGRTAYNASATGKVSVNDLIIMAAALSLMAVPEVNASFTAEGIIQHHNADVAVAVATESGLITPIVRAAHGLNVADISTAMKDLVARAQSRKLNPEEYSGGTFAVSNLGMFGITRFGSIINPPHGAILSIGAGKECAVVRNGQIVSATIMAVTLTCDHRVIDGATGARWLQDFQNKIEQPDALFA